MKTKKKIKIYDTLNHDLLLMLNSKTKETGYKKYEKILNRINEILP